MTDVRRRTGILGMVWLASLLAAEVLASAPVRVVLPESVTVSGDEILLGDVARIEGGADLGRLVLGQSPRPGGSLALPGSRIRIRILQEAPNALCEIPGVLRVERPGQQIALQRVQALLEKTLSEQHPGLEVRVQEVRIMGQDTFAQGRLTLGPLALSGPGRRVRGQTDVRVDGREAGLLRFVAQVDRLGPVVVPVRDLDRGALLRPEDLRVEKRDLTGMRENVLRDPAAAVGLATRVRISAGDVLRSDRLTSPPLVKRGDRVRMVVENENLRIHTLGEARRDGGQGDRIPVENLRTGKVVQAEVTAVGVVRLGF
ncbi:flagellar basal body P-ring formation chaperone FlgA [Desulfobotulus sp.]|uniref:flagellar basal body P-ring formation chaperone FlgA n=1 Tax=Desulfobotulus sp. TaxID=1940337 RepID=UPI002A35F6F1|nr:flagellar basal body P-ring formation chaperone FlgA [Desulfobotulus sp.]MDY0164730.1 flagellar basal body P-ring formation chaperone FlgA [Desulfobotulus sp.]